MTEGRKPRVSIGLPVFNAERYLEAALASMLSQTFRDFEIVIADNASTDSTEAICRAAAAADSRIRYFRNPTNIGGNPNHNRVFELSSGEYFRWSSYDDLIAPEFLERCIEVLDSAPDVALCFSLFNIIDQEGRVVGFSDPPPPVVDGRTPHERLRQFWRAPRVHQVIYGLIRRDALLCMAPMGDWYAADRATLLELTLLGKFARVDLPLFYHREHNLRSQHVDRNVYWSPVGTADTTRFGYWRRLSYAFAMLRRHSFSVPEQLAIVGEFIRYGIRRVPHWFPELVRELVIGVRSHLSKPLRPVKHRDV